MNKKITREKVIRKRFRKDWPFTVNKIIVVSLLVKSVYCRVMIDGKEKHYALNGFAEDTLNIPHIFTTDLVKSKIVDGQKVFNDIGGIIEIGLSLFKTK